MEIKKILWPTDFSSNAGAALPYVQSLSQKYVTEIHVLYVIPELGVHESWYGELETSHIEKIHIWEKEKAASRLNEVCNNHLNECPFYIKHIAIGDPAEEILKLAERENVDMIVMATHGKRGKFHFGSVTETVLKNSAIPVVTAPIPRKEPV